MTEPLDVRLVEAATSSDGPVGVAAVLRDTWEAARARAHARIRAVKLWRENG